MTHYGALVDGERGAYGAIVPDLPGCTSAADTIDDLRRNVIEAVRLWLEDAEADGEALPQARSLEELRQDPEVSAALAQGSALILVPVLRDYGHLKKANISLDTGLLEAIDAAAEEHGLTRSSFLATAAREKIGEGTEDAINLIERLGRLVQETRAPAAQKRGFASRAARRKKVKVAAKRRKKATTPKGPTIKRALPKT